MKKHLRTISALMCALLLAVPAISAAAVNNDEVTSIKLKEADNNGSQDTNSGSGVKTGHIQNLAVTGAKIAAGTITTSNIGNSQVTNAILAPNAVTTAKIQDGTIATADLANGAVTDAKISGTISVGKLPVGTGAATVAAGDHNHDSLYLKKYGKVAIVAQSGGDYSDPVTAMSNIASWCGTPSSSNPCLLKIMPGVYDLGSSSLVMNQYVDIEGAGENSTIITSAVNSGWAATQGTLTGANNAELRLLTVKNTGTGSNGCAIVNYSTSPSLLHVTAIASSAGTRSIGVFSYFSAPTLRDVTAVGAGSSYSYGIMNFTASPVMNNVTARAGYGVYSSVAIDNHFGSSPVMTNITATSDAAGGNAAAAINLDGSTSLIMNAVVSAAGGTSANYGFYLGGSPATISNSSVTVSGSLATGVWNNYSNSRLSNLDIVVVGAGEVGRGVVNAYSASILINVNAIAAGATTNYGLYNDSEGYALLLDRCSFVGSQNSVFNYAGDVKIGVSKLSGDAAGSGTFTCIGAYDSDYLALDSTCQ